MALLGCCSEHACCAGMSFAHFMNLYLERRASETHLPQVSTDVSLPGCCLR